MALSCSKLADCFNASPQLLDFPTEAITVFNTSPALRNLHFMSAMSITIGAICIAYALERGPLNLTVLSVCGLAPIMAGAIHSDSLKVKVLSAVAAIVTIVLLGFASKN